MKLPRRICAVLIGTVFVVAGLLKLMDPTGASLIVSDYLRFFHVEFLGFASGFAGCGAALLETLTGAALITGIWKKGVAILSGAMLAFFTVLTLLLWILNPEMDCGCFGEALHLTHAQSFMKNVVLDLLWVCAFVPFRRLESAGKRRYVSFFIVAAECVVFMIYSLAGIPLRDFTPYSVGTELRMEGEDGLEDSPALSFFDEEGNYRDSLLFDGSVLVVSVWKPAAVRDWDKIEDFCSEARAEGFNTLILCSGEAPLPFFYADRRDLLSLNRSNAGVTLVSEGQIASKWAASARPEAGKLKKEAATQMATSYISRGKLILHSFILGVFAVMLLV